MGDRNFDGYEPDEGCAAQVENRGIVEGDRPVFFSFHFEPDKWRAAQVRSVRMEQYPPVVDNDWETVKDRGDKEILMWIDRQLEDKVCTIVLIGKNTAGRKWINYEISRSWSAGKGLLGIYVHNLLDDHNNRSARGENPFECFDTEHDGMKLSDIVRVYDLPCSDSQEVYAYIQKYLETWIEDAISIRNNH